MSGMINVKGLDALLAELDKLPVKIEANAARSALRTGALVIANDAKRRVPVGEPSEENKRRYHDYAGALRASIHVNTGLKNGVPSATVVAGGKFKGTDTYYAHFVEWGTAAHWIRAAGHKSLFIAGLFKKAVYHPGAKAHPFMRPAMDSQAPAALQAFGQAVADKLNSTKLSSQWGTSAPVTFHGS
jgi:HK97 gp10 family phage protein